MNRLTALELVAELKGLVPFLTDEQGKVCIDEFAKRDDPAAVRHAMREYVTHYEPFTLAGLRVALPPRADLVADSAAEVDRKQRETWRAIGAACDAHQRADDELCGRLPDATYERVALGLLREDGDEIARLYAKRPLRAYRSLRSRVAAFCRENGIVTSDIMRVA